MRAAIRALAAMTIWLGVVGLVAEAEASQQSAGETEKAQDQRQVAAVDASDNQIRHDQTGSSEQAPVDIDDDKGRFVYSADGRRAVRLYGSFRTSPTWTCRPARGSQSRSSDGH
jgi:hypothetical protein